MFMLYVYIYLYSRYIYLLTIITLNSEIKRCYKDASSLILFCSRCTTAAVARSVESVLIISNQRSLL